MAFCGLGSSLLPFSGAGGHRSALSHTISMAGAGHSQTPFHLTSPSPCYQETVILILLIIYTINIPSLQLLVECIWPDLDVYGTFIGTSVVQAKRTPFRSFYTPTNVSKQGI